ncbi:MAG: glycosyltransferase family 39 protein [Candidatus Levybacteria bacterium]|nr:glycosyltransferase family 39 protein [Candidatus Levybacteria bacterium]
MTFLGDEGRDAIIVYDILHGDFTLLGPRSSAADFYYGPIYFYFIAPFLWLFNFNPVGPSVMVAMLGIATVFLVYKIGKEFFGTGAALVAASLYTISPLVVAYARSSWNPNPLPFFSLLIIYLVYKAVVHSSWQLFLAVGFFLGIAFQLQYISMFLAIIVCVYIALGIYVKEKNISLLKISRWYLTVLTGFLIGFSPFLGFEVLHGFPNTQTIINFLLGRIPDNRVIVNFSPINQVTDAAFRLFARLVWYFPPLEQLERVNGLVLKLWQIGVVGIMVISTYTLIKIKNKLQLFLLALWLFLGIGLFGFYRKVIYDYYFGFMFPLPFLLVGNALSSLWRYHRILRFFVAGLFFFLIIINLQGIPFRSSPNRQLEQVKRISEFVLKKTENKQYNFALITNGNSDHAYRYFFKLDGKDPITIETKEKDPQRKTVTNQLLIICEYPSCEPLGHPIWEIAGFGRAEIAAQWDVSVVKVYKLIHYSDD